jgi:hypothetical protein
MEKRKERFMRRIVIFMLLFFNSSYCLSQEDTLKVPDKYKDLKWHFAETKNFEILALKESEAEKLEKEIENVRIWVQKRWQLPSSNFNKKCMIVCVNSHELFKEFFHEDDVTPKVSVSKNDDNTDREVYCIWLSSGDPNWLYSTLPGKVGYVSLLNYENEVEKLPYWAYVGMSELSNSPDAIKAILREHPPEMDIFGVKSAQTGNEKQIKYYSMALCLMLRKEFGIKGFHKFLKEGHSGLGFRSEKEFKTSFYTYCRNLTYDIVNSKTPVSYFTWIW